MGFCNLTVDLNSYNIVTLRGLWFKKWTPIFHLRKLLDAANFSKRFDIQEATKIRYPRAVTQKQFLYITDLVKHMRIILSSFVREEVNRSLVVFNLRSIRIIIICREWNETSQEQTLLIHLATLLQCLYFTLDFSTRHVWIDAL